MLIGLVVPCRNEAGYIEGLLESLVPQLSLDGAFEWHVVLVNDSSTDGTDSVLVSYALRCSFISVVAGVFGSPGGARSAGAAWMLDAFPSVQWLVTVDADVQVAHDWRKRWEQSFLSCAAEEFGALNGGEQQDHLYASFPNARRVSEAFGAGLVAGEQAVGITNLNGVNHAVRRSAYLSCGPYVQPTMPGAEGMLSLAGEDWDLGVRIRRAGFTVGESSATVIDRGRRFLADVHAYVSGEAYEGAFRRLTPAGASHDIAESVVPELVAGALERSLRHFFFKPILAGAAPLPVHILSVQIIAEMRTWMERWPHPSFEESRNGFIFGRLERFSSAFTHAVQRELGLTPSLETP